MLNNFLVLVDVMVMGFYVVISVEVKKDDIVVVMGDGVVGLSGVFFVKLFGVKWIIVMSCYEDW